jgi:hypothetical protein
MLDAFKKAVINLAAKRLSREDFTRCYPPASATGYDVERLLDDAIETRDSDAVSVALTLAALFNVPVSTPMLADLLPAEWHKSHEDVVLMLQATADSRAVSALSEAALTWHSYLDQRGDLVGFARKCTWALADIGSDEARAALARIASSDNQQVAAYAQKRLDRWEAELPRKRHSRN